MENTKIKDHRQYHQDQIRQLGKEHDNIIIELATGVGKTLSALNIIADDNSNIPWYIIVPEILHIQNVKNEIDKHGYRYLMDNGKIRAILCYASLSKLEEEICNLWMDEVHHTSQLKEDILKKIKYNRIICTSATIPEEVRNRLCSLATFKTYKVTLAQAIEQDILPTPIIYVKYTYPDEIIYRSYKVKGKTVKMTDRGRIQYFNEQIKYWSTRLKEEELNGNYPAWMEELVIKFGLMRKRFTASTKTEDIKTLIKENLGGKRFIVFTGSIEQCNEIGRDYSINSGKSKAHNLSILTRFNNFEIDRIVTNKMGREGLNLEAIGAGVITQLGSGRDKGLEFLQIAGRAFRSVAPELYTLVAKDTVDEDNLRRALKNVDSSYVQYLND